MDFTLETKRKLIAYAKPGDHSEEISDSMEFVALKERLAKVTKLTLFIWLLFLPLASGDEAFNITMLPTNPGIYFEEIGKVGLYSNEWQVIIYYDLVNLKYELGRLQEYEKKIESVCQALYGTPVHEETQNLCFSIAQQLSIIMGEINEKSKLIYVQDSRNKRGLFNAVGTLSKTLFGTLDEEDAQKYDELIENVKNDQRHLLSLMRNQTLIIETTANVFNKTRSAIKNQFSHLEKKFQNIDRTINFLDSELSHVNVTLELESLISLTALTTMRYQATLNTILDLVTDVRHGKPHPSIITPKQVDDLLTEIQKHLPTTLTLPIARNKNSVLQIYRLGHVSTGIVKDKIIFELKVPLPFRENYQLYKVIPIPTPHKNDYVFIQPSLEYLVVDYNREHYYTLNKIDLGNCVTENLEYYMCRIIHPIFNVHSESNLCEIDLLKHDTTIPRSCHIKSVPSTNFWIQLRQPNKWLFVMDKYTTVDAICNDKIFPCPLNGSGIIEIRSGCYLRSKEFIIQAHNVQTSNLNAFYLPTINLTSTLIQTPPRGTKTSPKVAKTFLIKYNGDDELKELSTAIEKQKQDEGFNLNNTKVHTIHHYSISYLLLALVVIIFIILLNKKLTNKCKQRKVDIELKSPEQNPQEQLASTYTLTVA